MAAATKDEVSTMIFSADGSPSGRVIAKANISVGDLNASADGSPWWGIAYTTATDTIQSITEVAWTAIKKIGGIIISGIKKIGGIST